MGARIAQLERRHHSADERAARIREQQADLQQRLTAITEQLSSQGHSQQDHLKQVSELTAARDDEHRRRKEAETRLEEALSRLEAFRERTEPSLDRMQRENEEYARMADEARVAANRLQAELDQLRNEDRVADPINQTLQYLEEENAALRKKLALAEEAIVNAGKVVGGIADLSREVDRLGTLYLQAREEARSQLAAKEHLETELSQIVDRFLARSPVPLPPPSEELEEARRRIRAANADRDGGSTPD